jgi:hypothetical protein
VTIEKKALGPEHSHVAALLNNMAGLLASQVEYAKALPLHERALRVGKKALGRSEHPHIPICRRNLAIAQQQAISGPAHERTSYVVCDYTLQGRHTLKFMCLNL